MCKHQYNFLLRPVCENSVKDRRIVAKNSAENRTPFPQTWRPCASPSARLATGVPVGSPVSNKKDAFSICYYCECIRPYYVIIIVIILPQVLCNCAPNLFIYVLFGKLVAYN